MGSIGLYAIITLNYLPRNAGERTGENWTNHHACFGLPAFGQLPKAGESGGIGYYRKIADYVASQLDVPVILVQREQLSLGVKTVETYKSRLMQKLEFVKKSEFIEYAVKYGLLPTVNT